MGHHNTFNGERKDWSSTITLQYSEQIRQALNAERIVYSEQKTSEDDPVRQALDYAGIDAIAIFGRKAAKGISLRATKWTAPQVTIRSREYQSWTNRSQFIAPAFHVQLITNEGRAHTLCLVDLDSFRSLPNPAQYLERVEARQSGHFYRLTASAFALPCVSQYSLETCV
jgi:hypothetical protein